MNHKPLMIKLYKTIIQRVHIDEAGSFAMMMLEKHLNEEGKALLIEAKEKMDGAG